jgi:hypothetical protein
MRPQAVNVLYVKGRKESPDVFEDYIGTLRGVVLIVAEDTDAAALFAAEPPNAPLDIIILDAEVVVGRVQLIPLVGRIRGAFTGPIIATGNSFAKRKELSHESCQYQCSREDLPKMFVEVLHELSAPANLTR